jgi:hypothetical protein
MLNSQQLVAFVELRCVYLDHSLTPQKGKSLVPFVSAIRSIISWATYISRGFQVLPSIKTEIQIQQLRYMYYISNNMLCGLDPPTDMSQATVFFKDTHAIVSSQWHKLQEFPA